MIYILRLGASRRVPRKRRYNFSIRGRAKHSVIVAVSSAYISVRNRLVLFSALIISSYSQLSVGKVIIFSLKVSRLKIREVRGGEVLGPMGWKFLGWRDWVGRVGGWW